MSKIDDFLADIERRFPGNETPGYFCLILQDGKKIFERSFGYANLETKTLIGPQTIFHLGSETKQFTAYLIMSLVNGNFLSLNDDARTIVPYCRHFPYDLRISELLRHTSGVCEYLSKNNEVLGVDDRPLPGFAGGRSYFGREIARKSIQGRASLQKKPSGEHFYSNTNYVILGDVIEIVLKKGLGDIAKEWIFDPLQMKSSFFDTQRSRVVVNRATSYTYDLINLGRYHSRLKNFDVIGDVGIMTTAQDLIRWENNFWNDYSGCIKSMLNFPTVTAYENTTYGCGLAFGQVDGVPYMAHGGRMDGFKCIIVRFVSMKISFIYLANSDIPFVSSETIGRQIAGLVCV